jgi:hypothetical protein
VSAKFDSSGHLCRSVVVGLNVRQPLVGVFPSSVRCQIDDLEILMIFHDLHECYDDNICTSDI